MQFFFDTEFIEDGTTIELVSIGIVAEDGREYYAEIEEANLSRGDSWFQANVVPTLSGKTTPAAQVATEIVEFVGAQPQFWAYYADYDWVALCQLYGRMIDLPEGWPMFCLDLKQTLHMFGDPLVPIQNEEEHNALADARWNKQVYDWLMNGKR